MEEVKDIGVEHQSIGNEASHGSGDSNINMLSVNEPVIVTQGGGSAGTGQQKKLNSPERETRGSTPREGKDRGKVGGKPYPKKSGAENIPPSPGSDGQIKGVNKNRGKPMASSDGMNKISSASTSIANRDQGGDPLLRLDPGLSGQIGKVGIPIKLVGEPNVHQLGTVEEWGRVGSLLWIRLVSGGIWVLWDNNVVEVEVLKTHHQVVHTRVRYLGVGKVSFISFVYGSPRRLERMALWLELEAISLEFPGPWLVLGDFNSFLKAEEKKGGREVCWRSISEMQQCLSNCSVDDMGYKGPDFTWKHGRLHERPILLCNEGQEEDGSWLHARDQFEKDAKIWHQNVFKENMRRKNRLYSRLNGLDSYKYGRYDHNTELLQKELWRELQAILVREELIWFQSSRNQWLKYGDKNSRFFHSSTIARRRHNRIVTLKNEQGEWIADSDMLVNMATSFYQGLFSIEEERDGVFPIQNGFPVLTDAEKRVLAIRPNREEIRKTVFRMGKFKAPGPDGLSAVFFQSQWNVVGGSVCQLVEDIFCSPEKVRDINGTFPFLIPKKDSPENMKDFRPISLCNVVYKIITKIIAGRLKDLMPRIVSPNQCSFIMGRQGTDNIIIAQEVIHSTRLRKGRKGWMMIKVDLEKAYDRLDWSFVVEALKDIGLPDSLVQLIFSCISTASMRLLWNGMATKEIIPGWGIRQGDPISPYLFVLCMEKLAQLIQMAVETEAWKPIVLRKNAPPISHLLFADDIILCAEASLEQAHVINQVLRVFSDAFGQKISKEKTRVFFSKNVSLGRAKEISGSLGIGITPDLGKYLGVPLFHKRVTKNTFRNVLDRVQGRLSRWNQSSLTLAGRATLAKSVLESLPVYPMQAAVLPKGICNEVEKLTRSFLWGSSRGQRKTHLVSWKKVCTSKKEGGLGFRNQSLVNKAFYMKLGFNLIANKDSMWVKVLCSKYKVGEGFSPVLKRGSMESNVWKGIRSVWDQVIDGSRVSIGDGSSSSFWFDRWVPRVGRLVGHALADIPEESLNWRVIDCVHRGDWDWGKFNNFLSREALVAVGNVSPPSHMAGKDKLFWTLSSCGSFKVGSAYRSLSCQGMNVSSKSWDTVWKWEGPQRVKLFLWLLSGNKLLTNAERYCRHMSAVDLCPRCNMAGEDVDHVFRSCQWSQEVWSYWIEKNELPYFLMADLEFWLDNNLNRKERNMAWRLKFGVICWLIWKHRNDLVFNGKHSFPHEIFSQASLFVSNIKVAESILTIAGLSVDSHDKIMICWRPPPVGWITINTDGSFSGNGGSSSCGGVVRDEEEGCIMGFSKRDLLMIAKEWKVVTSHVYSEGNQVADRMATVGSHADWSTHWYSSVPVGCEELFLEDNRGTLMPRYVAV
ncbi:uncharacterized protein LOC133313201 [Gastrolobium bilobum]|uniref:uncharacterized protein LOC133313201 n=1 Tax=Gastrolobium bilobum TaxID=150636 RepID=UPI002AB0ACF5|nr:uncharacterized protein LOC133313201 [Gastrolobium bilobum]